MASPQPAHGSGTWYPCAIAHSFGGAGVGRGVETGAAAVVGGGVVPVTARRAATSAHVLAQLAFIQVPTHGFPFPQLGQSEDPQFEAPSSPGQHGVHERSHVVASFSAPLDGVGRGAVVGAGVVVEGVEPTQPCDSHACTDVCWGTVPERVSVY